MRSLDMNLIRILVVEDDEEWTKLFKIVSKKIGFLEIEFRADEQGALSYLEGHPVHIVSLDQNIPLKQRETSISAAGFTLLQEVVNTRPFARAFMYTAYGKTTLASRAGRLGGTEYFEKKSVEGQEDAIDVVDYFKLLETMAVGGARPDTGAKECGYIHWALGRGRDHLPGMLGTAAGHLRDAQEDGFDSAKASKALASLIERVCDLAYAQACALAVATDTGLPRELSRPNTISESLKCTKTIWKLLSDDSQLGAWHSYITASNPQKTPEPVGERFTGALDRLRNMRNKETHGHVQELSVVDLDDHDADLLALVDGLAYWADHPLLNSVRLHPDDRSRLQFLKIVGTSALPRGDVISKADLLKNTERRTSIQFLHRVGDREFLVDMFPFASMAEQAGKTPVPGLLLPRPNGFIRRSLATGEELGGIPVKDNEREAFRRIFGRMF